MANGPFETVTNLGGQIGQAADKVIESGLDQSLNFQIKMFDRVVGVEVRLKLLTKDPGPQGSRG